MTEDELKKSLAREAYEESLIPIRPGGVDGHPFWNAHARQFITAPAFEFKPVANAVSYRFDVTDKCGITRTFAAKEPTVALSPVWGDIPEGKTSLKVIGLAEGGTELGEAGQREFLRLLPFSADYPAPARSFAEAALMAYRYLFNMPAIQHMKTGEPDPEYTHYCYPSKMHASIIKGMLEYAALEPEHKAEAMEIANKSAEYLIRTAVPQGHPLASLPLTYLVPTTEDGKKLVAASKKDTIMMLYPAEVGSAMLTIYRATKNSAYLDYATAIGKQYLRLQRENGTWALILSLKDGTEVVPNACEVCDILPFLEDLSKITGDACYRDAALRGRDSIYERLESFEWEGQFEDINAQVIPYSNLSKHPAISSIFYLAVYTEVKPEFWRQARDVQRFSEDQFTVWQQDGKAHTPVVYEQYNCYDNVDASLAKMIRCLLFMYDHEHRPLDLAKARALGSSITRFQVPESGRIPTWCDKDVYVPGGDWINCMFASAYALKLLSAYEK